MTQMLRLQGKWHHGQDAACLLPNAINGGYLILNIAFLAVVAENLVKRGKPEKALTSYIPI